MRARSVFVLVAVMASACHREPESAEKPAIAKAATSASETDDTTVRITLKVPAVGTKSLQRRQSEQKLSLVLDGAEPGKLRGIEIEHGETEARREEVLSANALAVDGLRATFVEESAHSSRNGKPEDVPVSPVVGKTYVLGVTKGALTVANAEGAEPVGRERDAVGQAYAHFGKPDPMRAAIPEGRMRVGDHVLAMETTLSSILSSDPHTHVHDVSVVLASLDDGKTIATFDVSAIAEGDAGPVLTTTQYKGKLRIRVADGAPLELTIEGPVTAAPNQAVNPPGRPRGKGEARLSLTTTYE